MDFKTSHNKLTFFIIYINLSGFKNFLNIRDKNINKRGKYRET